MSFSKLSVVVSCVLFSGAALATAAPAKSLGKNEAVSDKILLYSAPKMSAQLVEQANPAKRFIPIYSEKEWVKVGDPSNGKIGWINKKQYHKTLRAWNKPDVQTVIVRTDKSKAGKPQVNIVAYSNGKKLSDKEAQAVYEKLRKQQQQEWKAMKRYNEHMNRFFERENQLMESMFQSPFFTRPFVMEPGPVIILPGESHQSQNKQAAKHTDKVQAPSAKKDNHSSAAVTR